jgi:hypothetical protein
MIGKSFPAKKEALISLEKAGKRIKLFINEKKTKYCHMLSDCRWVLD